MSEGRRSPPVSSGTPGTASPRSVSSAIRSVTSSLASLLKKTSDVRTVTPPPFDEDPCSECPSPCSHPRIPSYLLKKIDYDTLLEGTIQTHHRHVLVCTGRTDWPEKAESEEGSLVSAFARVAHQMKEESYKWADGGTATKDLKMVVTAISRPTEPVCTGAGANPALVLPEHERADDIVLLPEGLLVPRVAPTAVDSLVNTWLGSGHEYNSDSLVRALGARRLPYNWVVIICAHKRRDKRCGVAGPLIGETFETVLRKKSMFLPADALSVEPAPEVPSADIGALPRKDATDQRANLDSGEAPEGAQERAGGASARSGVGVFLASHTGGHKFAGNVIVYPGGIWYGRVTPCHVPAIVERHIEGGKVQREIYRGCLAGPEHGRTIGW